MKRIDVQLFALATVFVLVLTLSLSAHAQGASETLYKSKCAMCHGADGKKAAGHDLTSAAVQKSDLVAVITDGKAPKMPKYGDKLKPEEIKGLADYIKTLK